MNSEGSTCAPDAAALSFTCSGRDAPTIAEATFTLEVNEWGGVSEPRLVLRQARPAALRIEAERLDRAADANEAELVLFATP